MIIDSTKLRKLRDKQKISQEELADIIELSQSTIAKYEKENSQIKFHTLMLLCNCFKVQPSELLTSDSTQPQHAKNGSDSSLVEAKLDENLESSPFFDQNQERFKIINRFIAVLEKLI